MKVLYVIDTLDIGGAEQSTLALCKKFRNTRATVCHLYRADRLKPAFQEAGINVISLNVDGRFSFVKAKKAFETVIQQERPDLVHSILYRAGIVARLAAKSNGLPLVDSFVNDSYAGIRWKSMSWMGRLKLFSYQMLDRITAPSAFRFLALTETAKTSNCESLGVPLRKVTVIPRGRDPSLFRNISSAEIDSVRCSLHLEEKGPVLLNIARLIKRKGQAEIIQAMPGVIRAFPNARLLMAGDGPDRKFFEALIDRNGLGNHVLLLGNRNDIPVLLQLADIFVFPSHYEGQGGAIVEAMLSARAIVASDTPVHRESIQDQVSGILFSVRDVPAIEQAILWMLNHPQEAAQMGLRASQIAAEKFSLDRIAAAVEDFYEDTLQAWALK